MDMTVSFVCLLIVSMVAIGVFVNMFMLDFGMRMDMMMAAGDEQAYASSHDHSRGDIKGIPLLPDKRNR